MNWNKNYVLVLRCSILYWDDVDFKLDRVVLLCLLFKMCFIFVIFLFKCEVYK